MLKALKKLSVFESYAKDGVQALAFTIDLLETANNNASK